MCPSKNFRDDIAIIGISCRFPGEATSSEAFLEMLRTGGSAWSKVPKERFNIDAYYHPSRERRGASVTQKGYFLTEDPGRFDASFFSITAIEAAAMDPQQRLLLETTFEGLEDAGLPMSSVAGSDMACYIGALNIDYEHISGRDLSMQPIYSATGQGTALLSNRISWFYDLRGPSATISTGCSSSLVSLHLACDAIRSNKNNTRTALVGGCGLILEPGGVTGASALHFLSPDGRSYSFDERGNGYARGEGVGVIVLKHVEDALRDGDTIRAVIRGTGVNQDGHTSGMTLPSSEAQARLIRDTYTAFGLDMAETMYVEAHGTGTAAGDPLEARAIGDTLGAAPNRTEPIYIGSVKSNIGHLEGCAGIASLIKSVLSLESGLIFPQHDFQRLNPKIDAKAWRIKVPDSLTPWPSSGLRRASINSFGYGGTNSHAVLDDAFHYCQSMNRIASHNTACTTTIAQSTGSFQDSAIQSCLYGDAATSIDALTMPQCQKPRIFTVTCPDLASLKRRVSDLQTHLRKSMQISTINADQYLQDLAHTLNTRRSKFQRRTFVVASTIRQLIEGLEAVQTNVSKAKQSPGQLWVFTGQGAQWPRMGLELLQYRVFEQFIDKAEDYLKSLGATWSVKAELTAEQDQSRVNEPEYSQPLCTVIQIALFELLRYWGLTPSAVIGHSSGEIAAAYAIGALSVEDALKISFHRGRLTQHLQSSAQTRTSGMLSLGIPRASFTAYKRDLPLATVAVIACENSPSNITISGDSAALEVIERRVQLDGIFTKMVNVGSAYHSPYMESIAEDYLEALKGIVPCECEGDFKMYSTVTGRVIASKDLGPSYWVRNMTQPVEFVSALDQVLVNQATRRQLRKRKQNVKIDAIVELGAHGALQMPIKQYLDRHSLSDQVRPMSTLSRFKNSLETSLSVVGRLWSIGCHVNMENLDQLVPGSSHSRSLISLPVYPWNHTTRYWDECLQSVNRRDPLCAKLDYAGIPVEDFNIMEPIFKNELRVSDVPWVLDHKVQNDIIFPGTGMICAALEIGRQVATPDRLLLGFEMRDIRIGKALIIPSDGSGVQTFIRLKPHRSGSASSPMSWHEWSFYTISKDRSPTEHCSGLISALYHSKPSEVDNGREADLETSEGKKLYQTKSQVCVEPMNEAEYYDTLKSAGIAYGPTFQGLSEILVGNSTSCATITIPNTKAVMPGRVEMQSVIHPAALDAVMQSCPLSFTRDLQEALVLTSIDHMFIPIGMPRDAGRTFRILTQSARYGLRGLKSDIIAEITEEIQRPLKLTGVVATAIGYGSDQSMSSQEVKIMKSRVCSEPVVRLDLACLNDEQARIVLGKSREDPEELRLFQHDSSKAAAIWAHRTLARISPDIAQHMTPHFQHYYVWLEKVCQSAKEKTHVHQHGVEDWLGLEKEDEDAFLDYYENMNSAQGPLMNYVAQNLPGIMCGTDSAISLMMENDMLSDSYKDGSGFASGVRIMRDWFDLAGHKNPCMRILEVGAGTGSVTVPALEILGGQNGSPARFYSYTYTDISSGFFENAQKLLQDWAHLIQFKKLDIEIDPERQGFELGCFDVIVASNVLHATRNLNVTLSNCFKLLKPGGQLVLGELTRRTDYTSMVYGVLLGWWLGEDGRVESPLVDETVWDVQLRGAGFTGVDFAVHDTDEEASRSMTVMGSTKPFSSPSREVPTIILFRHESLLQVQAAAVLSGILTERGIENEILPFDAEIERISNKQTISLCELNSSMLFDTSEDEFEKTKSIIATSTNLLWVTSSKMAFDPNQRVVSGLFRSAMSENEGLNLCELHLRSQVNENMQSCMQAVAEAFIKNTCPWGTLRESEMIEVGGLLHIPRYIDNANANNRLKQLDSKPLPNKQTLVQADRPLKLTIGLPGMLDTLHFVEDCSYNSPIPADHVEIQVKANALNFYDVMVAMDKIPNTKIGIDAAGVVVGVGSSVNALNIGDRVAVSHFGACATIIRCHESMAKIIPKSMSLEEASTIPNVFMTAYQCLVHASRLQKGESVLIHAAAGGLGQALIQLAQHIGAEVYATVGTTAKKELLISLGVQEDHIFSSRDLSFMPGIMRMTRRKGVDVVINSLIGEALKKSWECVAEFGRFIEVGKVDIYANTGLDMLAFLKNRSFTAVNLEHMDTAALPRSAALLSEVFKLLEQEFIRPVQPITVYDYSDMETAFRKMQQGRHTGKIVLKVSASTRASVAPRPEKPLSLDPNSTYILSGGLGGLGRSQALRMARRGARNLVFLSRSGDAKPEAKAILTELRGMNVRAEAFSCDITDSACVQSVVAYLKESFPPIKGVIQGAMVLNDALLENMSFDKWLSATRPKIQGTWNLHTYLPKDLDFFVMLSSLSGVIGNRGQSNYAAGNTFLDAFAEYRRSLGLKAHSLDLGLVRGIGFFEENHANDASNPMNHVPAIQINEGSFLSIFESALEDRSDSPRALPQQLIIGAGSGALERLNKMDGKGQAFFWLSRFARFGYLRGLDLHLSGGDLEGSISNEESLGAKLLTVSTLHDAIQICQQGLVEKLARAIMVDAADIDVNKPLYQYGVDSLVAVEVRNWILKEMKSDVSVFEVLSGAPMTQLAEKIATRSKVLTKEVAQDVDAENDEKEV